MAVDVAAMVSTVLIGTNGDATKALRIIGEQKGGWAQDLGLAAIHKAIDKLGDVPLEDGGW